jgi:hypothetical protein
VNREVVQRLLDLIETPLEMSRIEQASGLVVELETPTGYRELLGPFPKDTAEAFTVIEALRAEEDADEPPNRYVVKLLFSPSHAAPRTADSPSGHLLGHQRPSDS